MSVWFLGLLRINGRGLFVGSSVILRMADMKVSFLVRKNGRPSKGLFARAFVGVFWVGFWRGGSEIVFDGGGDL